MNYEIGVEMTEGIRKTPGLVSMTGKDFLRLRSFIYDRWGINIVESKKTMLESRLQKRLRVLCLKSFGEYCEYLFSPEGMENELTDMINLVTTNKTDFFREPAHFVYLREHVLPGLTKRQNPVMVWSAGCSSGEEPYTLAMVFVEAGCDCTILATDISTKVLDKARLAVYDKERIEPIPFEMKKKYLLVSKDRKKGLYRIVPEVRNLVYFRKLNFMDGDFGFREQMDVIFCRNVIIYFDKPTQEKLLNKICTYLSPGGHLFMGHSETLFGMDVPLVQAAPTIYRRRK